MPGDILANLANKYSRADCFLIPIVTLYNALEIKKRKIQSIHDLVQFEFQELFAQDKKIDNYWLKEYKEKLKQFAAQGSFFCSNSDCVRKMHTLKYIDNIKEGNTGFVYIPVNRPDNIENRVQNQKEVLQKYNVKGEYIFYPTQIRPYKNLITLLKALRILLNKNIDLFLVLTGNLHDSLISKNYIEENGLKKKIVLTGDVPEVDLYSLHKYALATVVPTLFEGGFPWQGLEAMLMDAPAIMSRIPVVLERLKFAGIDPGNCGLKMFSPEDEHELAEKILEVLKDRDRAVIDQLPVKEKLFAYTWDDVSHQYYKIFTEKVLF
ncbi:MAG TPA: glycosyltransferase [bacterium]